MDDRSKMFIRIVLMSVFLLALSGYYIINIGFKFETNAQRSFVAMIIGSYVAVLFGLNRLRKEIF